MIWKVSWRKKGLWNLAREKILRETEALPKEEGDAVRKYQAMNEENSFSSWVRERWERERRKDGESQ